MLEKAHIENFLRINGVSILSPDDEIRETLLFGRWDERDVDGALLILRDRASRPIDMGAAHMLLFTDGAVSTRTLSALLNIDIVLNRQHLRESAHIHDREVPTKHIYIIGVLAVTAILAVLVGITSMYLLQIGPFYSPISTIY